VSQYFAISKDFFLHPIDPMSSLQGLKSLANSRI